MKKFKTNVLLSSYTTFRIGGAARYFTKVNSREELIEAYNFANSVGLPLFVLGGGSNVLISDNTLDAVVIHLINDTVIINKQTKKNVIVTAEAGKNWDDFVNEMVKSHFHGIECLSGIPGTVGAAPIQNIGAYGQELKDTFYKLVAFDEKASKFVTFNKDDCKFGYRDSIFKSKRHKGRYIIFSVTLKLEINTKPTFNYSSLASYLNEKDINNPTLEEVRDAVLAIREMKLENPTKIYNSGSFFKNPIVTKRTFTQLKNKYPDIPSFPHEKKVKLSAGWLIDNVGWKGKMHKNVGVSNKHALVLVNPEGKGTAKEIMELATLISNDVKKKFNVELTPEVNYIN